MADWDSHEKALPDWVGWTRLAAGLAQGIALYLLTEAVKQKVWPATAPMLNGALWAAAIYTPLVKIEGLGRLRLWTLSVWATVVVASLAGLGAYSVWRDVGHSPILGAPELLSWPMMAGAGVCLFIVNALIAGADADRRLVGRYATYFDIAWKQGLQLALSCGFVGVFWVILFIGASLFKLVHIDALEQLIGKAWFYTPASSVAFAAALHLTDVRHSLISGGRALVLGLLSWLTPLLTALIIAFLAALPFTGLKPLWATHHAAGLMFTAAVGLILLINTIYQNGAADRGLLLRITVRAGALALAPLALIAGQAMWLRIDQYGLTAERVIAAALALIVVVYAVAYALCALKPKPWMGWLAPVNIALSVFSVAVVLALMTQLADPARLGTADQVRRLESGRTSPDKFDFLALKFKEARYGRAALKRLAAKPGAIGDKAKAALAAEAYVPLSLAQAQEEPPVVAVQGAKDAPSPAFAPDEWHVSDCHSASACQGVFMQFPNEKSERLLVLHQSVARADLMEQGADGKWSFAGSFSLCPGDREALLAGKATHLPPSGPGDLSIGGRRAVLEAQVSTACGKPK